MTRITKITMDGFKSFQRKTAVPCYPGLTAIVGTNGSGKSNIQEAIQFVMGQRSSQLRAEKLEQLIFNGGENRKPSEAAEVTLRLDNSEGVFDHLVDGEDEGADEITIGRKIKRNGYSTYRFMGSNCKRSMIDRVLDAAGVDGDHHIVQQGEVTGIVKQSATERRKAIDRISGIAAYEEKEENALDELEQVEEELNELELELEYKKQRLERLEEDKEDAEAYQELQEEKRVIEASILSIRENELENQLDNLPEEGQETIDELEEQVEELDEELDQLEDRRDEIEEEIEAERDDSLVRDIEKLKGKIQRKEDAIEAKKEKISDIESILEDYRNMQQSRSGSNRTIEAVLGLGKDGVHGTVADLVHYKDRFAVALETAAGKRMDNIVVDDQQTATECVNYLKENSIGRATFLPIAKVNPRNQSSAADQALKMPGVIDYAINLVDYDQQYGQAIKYVFGDTLVAEDLESLKDAGRVRAVTLDGDIMRKGGSITGGKKKKRRTSKKRKKRSGINPEEKKQEKEGLEDEIEELQAEIAELRQLLNEKEEEEEESSQVSEDLKEEKQEVKERIQEVRDERRETAEELNNLRNEIGDAQKKRAKFEAELQNVKDDLEDYDDVEERLDKSLSTLRSKKTKTINRMNELGNVNMKAIEEYEEFKERVDDFREKVDTIRQEKREIEQIIEDIEQKKRNEFMDALETVNDHFQRIFTTLFEGGEASLELEDEEDIDSGLLIKAQPPNKDPHVLDSLSGGEKSLTAIAFIFALQEHNPSPFYVMDEIDAALDAKNAERLADLLDEYADEYQFLVISHNNETVKHADRAYGVSMQEGVSKIRSVDLEEMSG